MSSSVTPVTECPPPLAAVTLSIDSKHIHNKYLMEVKVKQLCAQHCVGLNVSDAYRCIY